MHLNELRRNPSKNTKESLIDFLSKYPNDYVRFSDQNKVGINPRFTYYDTPLGVYAYPINYVLKHLRLGQNREIIFYPNHTFIENKFIHILEYTGNNEELLVIDTNIPILEIYKKRYLKFISKYDKLLSNSKIVDINDINNTYIFYRRLESLFYNLNIETKMEIFWTYCLRQCGVNAILDKGQGLIHSAEPAQIGFLSPKIYKIKDHYHFYEEHYDVVFKNFKKWVTNITEWKMFLRKTHSKKLLPKIAEYILINLIPNQIYYDDKTNISNILLDCFMIGDINDFTNIKINLNNLEKYWFHFGLEYKWKSICELFYKLAEIRNDQQLKKFVENNCPKNMMN